MIARDYRLNICPKCKKAQRFDWKGKELVGEELKQARQKMSFTEWTQEECDECKHDI